WRWCGRAATIPSPSARTFTAAPTPPTRTFRWRWPSASISWRAAAGPGGCRGAASPARSRPLSRRPVWGATGRPWTASLGPAAAMSSPCGSRGQGWPSDEMDLEQILHDAQKGKLHGTNAFGALCTRLRRADRFLPAGMSGHQQPDGRMRPSAPDGGPHGLGPLVSVLGYRWGSAHRYGLGAYHTAFIHPCIRRQDGGNHPGAAYPEPDACSLRRTYRLFRP